MPVSPPRLPNRACATFPRSRCQAKTKKNVSQYFRGFIAPILSQQIIDAHHPFPHLNNKALYVAAHLKDKKDRDALGLVPIPESLPPFFTLRANGKSTRYIRTEHIVLQHAAKLFLPYQLVEACVLCVTRNADIRFDDEKFEDSDIDYRNRVSKLLKKRGNLTIVRMKLSRRIGEDFLSLLKARVGVDQKQIYFDSAPLCMGYVYPLCAKIDKMIAAPLSFPPHQPRQSEDIDPERGMIEQICARDRLLSFPYDSIDQDHNLSPRLHVENRADPLPCGGKRKRGHRFDGASRTLRRGKQHFLVADA